MRKRIELQTGRMRSSASEQAKLYVIFTGLSSCNDATTPPPLLITHPLLVDPLFFFLFFSFFFVFFLQVALMCENSPEFLFVCFGLAKIGVTAALINTNLSGSMLTHALVVARARHIIASSRFQARIVDVSVDFPARLDCYWINSHHPAEQQALLVQPALETCLQGVSTASPDRALRAAVKPRDAMFYIYTSGTTGRSKAAKFSHLRFIGAGLTWSGPCGLSSSDKYYISLPLYHGNALVVALSPCIHVGCAAVLRERFTASGFLDDVRRFNCTAAIYIGELWRYLIAQPQRANDHVNPLRVIVGNGLRADIWQTVMQRFGIDHAVEHYGATEMPGAAVLNWTDLRPGSCGFVPPAIRQAEGVDCVIAFDVDTCQPVRTKAGFCVPVATNGVGELIMRLTDGVYDGYVETGDGATERKIYRNVFEQGDAWWSSGDLIRIDECGFFYFVDRVGDAYRWKAENVSTNEVCDVLSAFPTIKEANIYGVSIPGCYGRAGMASLVLHDNAADAIDLKAFYDYATLHLPSYARPVFLRIRREDNAKTSTLKFQKQDYMRQGFNPSTLTNEGVSDMLFFGHEAFGTYRLLDEQLYHRISTGGFRL
ncbi:acyl-CoA synthetase [Capsaspora owczarzaki ATCC 30864]|uniref:acyl-CoA synthetase n=1 Tax=Capsaspora owczarzaki (strain ATCC 30864) TaxID=595528 RepID=UPI0001FE4F61|nr:acyl-CoA synthetase [Capsaspora owczarzaki ATCC 30864]|eukprot:XP_004346953.1 acyl-CoA synthetase [Capsaspora owczarzaki ATCC 30864]